MVACFNGHEAVVRVLREAGASWKCKDRGGSTPLHWAIDSGNPRLIQWMIDDGAEVNLVIGEAPPPVTNTAVYFVT